LRTRKANVRTEIPTRLKTAATVSCYSIEGQTAVARAKKAFESTHNAPDGSYEALYGFVRHSFKSMNRRIKSKFPVYRTNEETTEHVQQANRVFGWLVLPLSISCIMGSQIVLGQNVIWPTAWIRKRK
jgi:hypothetical protein